MNKTGDYSRKIDVVVKKNNIYVFQARSRTNLILLYFTCW